MVVSTYHNLDIDNDRDCLSIKFKDFILSVFIFNIRNSFSHNNRLIFVLKSKRETLLKNFSVITLCDNQKNIIEVSFTDVTRCTILVVFIQLTELK